MKVFLILFTLFSQLSFSDENENLELKTDEVTIEAKKPEVSFKTQFGKCPAHSAGQLALKLGKTFEKDHSLRDVKKQILNEKLESRYFLANYKVKYNPVIKEVQFDFNCPVPTLRVQVYKEDSSETYEAILGDNGELYDPTFEVLLRQEKKLKEPLPNLAIPTSKLDKNSRSTIADMFKKIHLDLKHKLSEMIINDKNEMTIILSIKNQPSSVFLGKDEWEKKVKMLSKIINYTEGKEKIPTVINLTNSKKVVVKFSDKF